MDVSFFFLERNGLVEVSIAELFAIQNVTIFVLDDEPESGSGRIFEFDAELNGRFVAAEVLNTDLFFGQVDLFITAIAGQGVQGIANEGYDCDSDYCEGLYYTIA